MINRYFSKLEEVLEPNKVLVIYGPRRVGKTTLVTEFLKRTRKSYIFESGDNIRVQDVLSSQDFDRIKDFVGHNELVVLDEAQRIPNIGLGLKIITDQIPNVLVIATGSSSFDLANKIGEPLTGRKWTRVLYPVAQLELAAEQTRFQLHGRLETFLVFGGYPEVVTASTRSRKQAILEEIVNSYLLKDILDLEQVKSPRVLLDLLRLIAFQVGREVSTHELAVKLGLNVRTVERYLDLLEKTFVITRLGPLSRNLRNEIRKKQKYFFLDNGIRNAVISQVNQLETRNDIGQLWENFVVMERMKKRGYKNIHANTYFWRTYDGQEVDLVEERDGKLHGYECKWAGKKEVKQPKDWLSTYHNASFEVITSENYLNFVT